jgi:hypothetical protein
MHRLNFDYQNKPRTLTERRVKGETGLTFSLISQSQTGRVAKKAARRWTPSGNYRRYRVLLRTVVFQPLAQEAGRNNSRHPRHFQNNLKSMMASRRVGVANRRMAIFSEDHKITSATALSNPDSLIAML